MLFSVRGGWPGVSKVARRAGVNADGPLTAVMLHCRPWNSGGTSTTLRPVGAGGVSRTGSMSMSALITSVNSAAPAGVTNANAVLTSAINTAVASVEILASCHLIPLIGFHIPLPPVGPVMPRKRVTDRSSRPRSASSTGLRGRVGGHTARSSRHWGEANRSGPSGTSVAGGFLDRSPDPSDASARPASFRAC